MTLGYFAPLPPAATGVADYAQALLGALRQCGEVRVADALADALLYQIGNNHLHAEIYTQALQRPGVVLLHDAVLHHFLLGYLSEQDYVREFIYNYGVASQDTAKELWKHRSRCTQDERYFHYPLLRRLLAAARAVIVHNPAAARMVERHSGGIPIVEIPHLYSPAEPPTAWDTARFRQQLGIQPHEFLFGIFGHLRETKRVYSALRAYASLRESGLPIRLLLAGDPASPDMARSLRSGTLPSSIVRLPYLPGAQFWQVAHAVDACLNLRHPSVGETSGIAIRLMGIGKPLVVTEGDEWLRLPASACVRVPSGITEEPSLREAMEWLVQEPTRARTIGFAAATHIQREHALPRAAERVWQVCQLAMPR